MTADDSFSLNRSNFSKILNEDNWGLEGFFFNDGVKNISHVLFLPFNIPSPSPSEQVSYRFIRVLKTLLN